MKFRSFSNRPVRDCSPSGSPERQLYTRKIDSAGNKSLEKSGKENVFIAIQLAANGNLAKDLVARSLRGDESAIGSTDSLIYADITGAPKSLLEAENRLLDARSFLNLFPLRFVISMVTIFGASLPPLITVLGLLMQRLIRLLQIKLQRMPLLLKLQGLL